MEERDRELENLLGQFLVASFQTDKLSELIHEKLSFRNTVKEMRIVLRSSSVNRQPLLITVRVEPFNARAEELEKRSLSGFKILCILESPELDINPSKAKNDIENMMQGSFEWWSGQSQYNHLKLDEWTITTVALSSENSHHIKELYRAVRSLETRKRQEPEV